MKVQNNIVLNSDLTALNDAGAIQGMEVREGDGIYITYTDGADTVIKKLVNGIIDLGTGTAFNISNRTSNYKNLTINDFIIEVNSFSVGSSSYYKVLVIVGPVDILPLLRVIMQQQVY